MSARTSVRWALAISLLAAHNASSQTPIPSKTIWDGAYTDAQAKRGEAVYAAHCVGCHAADLSGQNSTLIGERFMRDWREDNLNTLYRRVKATMPRRTPGSLTDEQYLDVVAYVLKQNQFPAGGEDLNPAAALGVQIVGKDGPQPVPDFALVQTVGCLTESGNQWVLTHAAEPTRSRNPVVTLEDVKALEGRALGEGTFGLLDVFTYKPATRRDHKVAVKGLLIRKPAHRLNVTGMETIAATCAP
jgi:mono/diheme cytochrome c family protein